MKVFDRSILQRFLAALNLRRSIRGPALDGGASNVSYEAGLFIDALAGAKANVRLWRSVATLTAGACVPLALLVVGMAVWNMQNADQTKVILSPAVQRFEVATPGQVTDSYIKAAFEHVAERNSSWTYESVEENYKELFASYYSNDLATRTQANLAQSDRFAQIRKNRMVSTFKIDQERSEYTWCEALNLACGLVVGQQTLFIDGNQPFRSEAIAYLIFSESIFPTRTNPFSLKVTRLVIGEYESLKKALEAAKKGDLPDDIQSKTF